MVLPPHIRHRCNCRRANACPGPIEGHGTFGFHIEAGTSDDGKRKQIQRRGFPSVEAAEEAMAALRSALPLVHPERARTRGYWRAAAEMLAEDLRMFTLSRADEGGVYVARATSYLKIGYSDDPQRRVAEIRRRPSGTRHLIAPADLDRQSVAPWLSCVGSRADEVALHWLARNYRAQGEWFYADGPLVEALGACIASPVAGGGMLGA